MSIISVFAFVGWIRITVKAYRSVVGFVISHGGLLLEVAGDRYSRSVVYGAVVVRDLVTLDSDYCTIMNPVRMDASGG
ncbi:hypothetical protein MUK42_07728 [Musa troglodytarum]|uniref:Uncharacterized protein n=1 Tax=Musa troglodytarum TaxID=320322 RepID=A0A9E7K8B3_9LILI|nr:hypothetical protein MUK42_07728 [Musa troglodytarum]